MCRWHGGTYEGNVPVRLAHPRKDGIQTASVDPCIQSIVQSLNDAGLQTLNSCCGHGIRPGWVALEDGRHILIAADHAMMRKMDSDFPALDGDENWLTRQLESCKAEVATWSEYKREAMRAALLDGKDG